MRGLRSTAPSRILRVLYLYAKGTSLVVAVVRLRGVLSARSGIMNSYQNAILCDWDGARAQYSNFLHEESTAHRAASVFSRFPIFPFSRFLSVVSAETVYVVLSLCLAEVYDNDRQRQLVYGF